MRNFEQDFDYDFEAGNIRAVTPKDYRLDVYPTVVADYTEHSNDVQRKARIVAHTDRVQRELRKREITKGTIYEKI